MEDLCKPCWPGISKQSHSWLMDHGRFQGLFKCTSSELQQDFPSTLGTMLTSCCGCSRRVRPRSRTTSAERSSSSLTRASCLRATATTAAPRGWAPDTRWATTATPRPSTTMTSSKLASRNCCRQRNGGGGESRDAVKYVYYIYSEVTM